MEYILNQAQNWLGSPAAHKLGIMADACNPHFQGFTLSIMSSSLPLAIWQLPEYPGVREGHGAQSQNKKKKQTTQNFITYVSLHKIGLLYFIWLELTKLNR